MPNSVFGCQPFAVAHSSYPDPMTDLWQFVSGLEAVIILILWLCWMSDARLPKDHNPTSGDASTSIP